MMRATGVNFAHFHRVGQLYALRDIYIQGLGREVALPEKLRLSRTLARVFEQILASDRHAPTARKIEKVWEFVEESGISVKTEAENSLSTKARILLHVLNIFVRNILVILL